MLTALQEDTFFSPHMPNKDAKCLFSITNFNKKNQKKKNFFRLVVVEIYLQIFPLFLSFHSYKK